jgi:hypothetical protein
MSTDADSYVAGLPAERREVVEAVRDLVNRHLPDGYTETVAWGMLTWAVPLGRYPDTYNGQALGYLALAAQKRHYSLYLMGVYMDEAEAARFRRRWEATGRRLDLGKSCLRFAGLDDLDQDLLAEVITGTPVDDFLRRYEANRAGVARP